MYMSTMYMCSILATHVAQRHVIRSCYARQQRRQQLVPVKRIRRSSTSSCATFPLPPNNQQTVINKPTLSRLDYSNTFTVLPHFRPTFTFGCIIVRWWFFSLQARNYITILNSLSVLLACSKVNIYYNNYVCCLLCAQLQNIIVPLMFYQDHRSTLHTNKNFPLHTVQEQIKEEEC